MPASKKIVLKDGCFMLVATFLLEKGMTTVLRYQPAEYFLYI